MCCSKKRFECHCGKKWHWNGATASLAAFGTSGICHLWVAYFTFGRGVLRAWVFFLVQVPWIVLENSVFPCLGRSSSNNNNNPCLSEMLRRVVTSFFFASLPIYAGLFIESYPQWLAKSDPRVLKLPFLWDTPQWLMTKLDIQQEHWR